MKSARSDTEIHRPSEADIWAWLECVPDPEIPVLSVLDLGIVRAVGWEGETLIVTVTPTYSGCPATSVIAFEIESALVRQGLRRVTIKQQLSPAWTTDWMTANGREKLERYGIAPPSPAGGPDRCPNCQSTELERVSQFGSTPCKAQWRCLSCLEPFEYFKCH